MGFAFIAFGKTKEDQKLKATKKVPKSTKLLI